MSAPHSSATIQFPDVEAAKERLIGLLFLPIECALAKSDAQLRDANFTYTDAFCVQQYSDVYCTVYKCCTQQRPYNFTLQLCDLLKAQTQRAGEKYELGSLRMYYYIAMVSHAFKYLDRFHFKRSLYPDMQTWLETQMLVGQQRAACRRRWRLIRRVVVYGERNAKIAAEVDLFLINRGEAHASAQRASSLATAAAPARLLSRPR